MQEKRFVVFLKGSPYKLDEYGTLEAACRFVERQELEKRRYGDFTPDAYEVICTRGSRHRW